MLEAAKYSAVELLRNGLRVEIRSLRPDDRAELVAAVGRTSTQSLFRRFSLQNAALRSRKSRFS